MWDDNNRNNGCVRKGGDKTVEKENKQATSLRFLIPETQMCVWVFIF